MKPLCLLVFATLGIAAAPQGVIRGNAVTAAGEVVRGATVFAFPVSSSPLLHVVPGELTDDNGEFTIQNLPFGEYRIETMKEEDGYPRTYSGLFKREDALRVILTSDKPVAFIRVLIGPRAAVVSGSLIDRDTGKPILNAKARMWRVSDPSRVSVAALKPNFRLLVPPGEDIELEITSEGHENWRISDAPLHLTSGSLTELKEVRVVSKPSN